ncbi:MAG: NAD(P)-dependent glycerol-3-phosphate dehydrogenase [Deltaproteobacteria bacterium]|nr:NAD(P)-dependent glycerol-3-phosphate dehydrogenase [Deltaproteobacteria bacterium]
MNEKVAVIGAGAWGTTLANLLAKKGINVSLWVFEKDLAKRMGEEHENRLYLPGVLLSERLVPSSSVEAVAHGCRTFLLVTPSHVTRKVIRAFAPSLPDDALVISAGKGIENETLMTLSEVLPAELPQLPKSNFAYLSGPSFAREVAAELPTAVSVASKDRRTAEVVQQLFSTPYFRVYTTPDVVGVELGGAVKNVMAIAAGLSDGLGFGYDTRAALITRGLNEMSRLGTTLGALPRTFMGLAGLGDLVLTCTGDLSRNRTVGLKLAEGKTMEEIVSTTRTVAEGIRTTRSVHDLAAREGVEMPITRQVYRILYEGIDPKDAVRELMSRDPKDELEEEEDRKRMGWSS